MIVPLTLALLIAYPAPAPAPAVDLTPRQAARLRVGEVLVLRLPCAHGGECRWELFGLDPTVLARDALPESEPHDWGVAQVYRLRAVAPGRCTVRAWHAAGTSRPVGWAEVDVMVTEAEVPVEIDEEEMCG